MTSPREKNIQMKVLERSFPKSKRTQVDSSTMEPLHKSNKEGRGALGSGVRLRPTSQTPTQKTLVLQKQKTDKNSISLSHVSLLTFDGSQLTGFGVTPLVDLGGGSRLFSWKLGRFGGGAWGNICSFR